MTNTPTTPQSPPADAGREGLTNLTPLQNIAKDAAERAAKNAGTAPQLLFAPILWALENSTLTADRDAALAEVKRLREALRPFAIVSEHQPKAHPNYTIWMKGVAHPLAWGDFHRACAALAGTSETQAAETRTLLRVDVAGRPVLVMGNLARQHLEAVNAERAQMRLELARLRAELDRTSEPQADIMKLRENWLTPIAPDARKGKAPCGECCIRPGETCDICGASETQAAGDGA